MLAEKTKTKNPSMKTFLLDHSMSGLAMGFHDIEHPGSTGGVIVNSGDALFNPYGNTEKDETIAPEVMTDVQRGARPTAYQRLPFQNMATFDARALKEASNHVEMRVSSLPSSDLVRVNNPLGTKTSFSQTARGEYETDPYSSPKFLPGTA